MPNDATCNADIATDLHDRPDTWTYLLATGSQPHRERDALADVATGRAAVRPVWVLGWGYACVRLTRELTQVGELFIILCLPTVGVFHGIRRTLSVLPSR